MTHAPPRPRVPGASPPPRRGKPRQVSRSVYRRRRAVALAILLAVVAGVVAGFVWMSNRSAPAPLATPTAQPAPGATILGPTPTPALSPIERETGTALQAALPDAVLQWALTEQAGIDLTETAQVLNPTSPPLEGYTLTYSDGEQTATLSATQWRTPTDAQAAAGAVAADGQILREEDVLVETSVVGHMVATADQGSETVVWTNGALLLVLIAPGGEALAFYDAMGL